jgi:hypothetical protein
MRRERTLVGACEEDERLGGDIDVHRDAALEPAHVLVDEVEREQVAARIGRRRDVNRHERGPAWWERVRERRSQAPVDDDRAVARAPAVADANLGDTPRPGRPDVAAFVRHPHVHRACLARGDCHRRPHDLEPRAVELRRRRPAVPVTVDLGPRRVPKPAGRRAGLAPGSPDNAASIGSAFSLGYARERELGPVLRKGREKSSRYERIEPGTAGSTRSVGVTGSSGSTTTRSPRSAC